MAAKRGQKRRHQPTTAVPTGISKTPATAVPASPLEDGGQPIVWRFGDADLGGDWAWNKASGPELLAAHKFLSGMEKKTWSEAFNRKGMGVKQVRLADCPNPAVAARLRKIERDDVEDLWEFHLGGEPRVWGIRRGSVCYLLWWDPGHGVWPVKKK